MYQADLRKFSFSAFTSDHSRAGVQWCFPFTLSAASRYTASLGIVAVTAITFSGKSRSGCVASGGRTNQDWLHDILAPRLGSCHPPPIYVPFRALACHPKTNTQRLYRNAVRPATKSYPRRLSAAEGQWCDCKKDQRKSLLKGLKCLSSPPAPPLSRK